MTRAALRRLVLGSVVSLALGACVTDSLTIPAFGPYSETTKAGRYVDRLDFPTRTYAFEAERVRRDATKVLREGDGFVDAPHLAGYLQTVMDRVAAGGPRPDVRPRVLLAAKMMHGATAFPTGVIVVNLGQLEHLKNEDQLAFVLAHEYAHVLLGHTPDTILTALRPYLVTVGELALGRTANTNSKPLLALYAADMLSRDFLDGSWSRQEEAEADRLGIDLMTRANYNPDAAIDFTKILEAADRQLANASEPILNQLELSMKDFNGQVEDKQASGGADPLHVVFAALFQGLRDMQGELRKSHERAEERRTAMRDYIEREYEPSTFRDLAVKPYERVWNDRRTKRVVQAHDAAYTIGKQLDVAKPAALDAGARELTAADLANQPYTVLTVARIRERQNRLPQAVDALQRLVRAQGDAAPLRAYQMLASLQRKQGRLDDAWETSQLAFDRFNGPVSVYRNMVELAKARGDQSTASRLRTQCLIANPLSRKDCGA